MIPYVNSGEKIVEILFSVSIHNHLKIMFNKKKKDYVELN